MAEQVGEIWYSVDLRAEKMMQQVPTVTKGLDKLGGEMDKVDKSTKQLNTGMTKLASAIGAVIAASALRDMAKMVQSYQEMAERVQMATSSQEEFEMVQRRLLATANGTYRSLAEAQELYIRTADSLRSMGYTTQQAIDVTDSMSYAFVRNATSADRASAATSALSKSLNTGKVAADQWETITTALPSVINDIAAASNRTAEEVRALGAAGKLTARDLSEGLRKSLDDNAQAAANMANNLTDAGVRMRTALTVVLVALEQQSGALQTFTNALIMGADMMIEFAGNGDAMAAAITTLSTGLTAVAAVLAGRMIMALTASTTALYASTIAASNKARADLLAAQSAAALAAQELIQARAAEQAAIGLSTHAAAAARLATAQATATTATAALTVAQRTMAGVATIATTALTGLRTVMMFLGGPVGVVLLAATALYSFASAGRDAKPPTDDLTKSVNELSQAQRELAKIEATKAIQALEDQAKSTAQSMNDLATAMAAPDRTGGSEKRAARYAEDMARYRVEIEKTGAELDKYKQRLADLTNYKAPEQAAASGEPAAPTTSPEGQKKLAEMREELELAKLTGEARAKLQAIQKLGTEATKEERAEAEKLAAEIYKLEEAEKALKKGKNKLTEAQKEEKKAKKELIKADEENLESLKKLSDEVMLAAMHGKELAAATAELKLNEYATTEQVEQARALGVELERLNKIEEKRKKFGDNNRERDEYIEGNVTPLSGGSFDQQTARYEAEGAAEEKRYQAQQERLKEALDLQLVTKAEYQEMELAQYQTHNDRMQQIDEARQEMQLATWAQGFGDMANNLKAFAGTFADENSEMFKVAKAAAIAQAVINTYQAATGAMASLSAIPIVGPALGIAAAAAAVAGGMAQVANIRSQSMGARQYGGPVAANSMYRINENGAPEVFNAANGRQFMLPNTRGEVVSNREATGGMGQDSYGGQAVTVNQTINVTGTVDRYTRTQLSQQAARRQQMAQARLGSRG